MHDLLLHFLALLPSPSPSGGTHLLDSLTPSPSPSGGGSDASGGGVDNSVKVAIVTAIGVVMAAAVTAFASTFQRRSRATPTPTPTPSPTDAFTRDYINGLLKESRQLHHLREGCVERGLDPDDIIREQARRDASTP